MARGFRLIAIVLSIMGAIVALGMSGPLYPLRIEKNDNVIRQVESAADLDAYLEASESNVKDLNPKLKKKIIWADPTNKTKTPLSFVYLHGFSASPKETSPFPETVSSRLNSNIYFYRLKGHSLSGDNAFANITAQDWIDDAREALAIGRKIGNRVILIGMSTGAALTLQIIQENLQAKDIAALILMSPIFDTKDPRAKFASGPFGNLIARAFVGEFINWKPENTLHAEYTTHRYRTEGIVALMNLVNHVRSLDLSQVLFPTLVVYTENDRVINTALIKTHFEKIGSGVKKLVDLPEAKRHELAGEALAPDVVEPLVQTVERFLLEDAQVTK